MYNTLKFIPNKEHLQTALIFRFHLKKTAAESHQLLQEAYSDHASLEDMCEQWFRHLKIGNFDVAYKEHGKLTKKYKDVECKHCLAKMICKHKNNSHSNWELLNMLFQIAYER